MSGRERFYTSWFLLLCLPIASSLCFSYGNAGSDFLDSSLGAEAMLLQEWSCLTHLPGCKAISTHTSVAGHGELRGAYNNWGAQEPPICWCVCVCTGGSDAVPVQPMTGSLKGSLKAG